MVNGWDTAGLGQKRKAAFESSRVKMVGVMQEECRCGRGPVTMFLRA
jgi:hypothetical protein